MYFFLIDYARTPPEVELLTSFKGIRTQLLQQPGKYEPAVLLLNQIITVYMV